MMKLALRLTHGVAVCVLLVACQPAAAPTVTPTALPIGEVSPFITVAPSQAAPGQSLTISGAAWRASEEISLAVQPADPGLGVGLSGGVLRADAAGRFELAVMLPQDMRPGVWTVVARGATPERAASVSFAVLASTREPGALATYTPMPSPTETPAPAPTDTPTALPTQPAPPTATRLPPTPTRTPAPPTPTATPPVITDWRGDYFNNPTLAGNPAFTRNDPSITFDWGNGSPDPRLSADGFSARWTRRLYFDAGLYRFTVRVDDGARVFVDGVLVIDEWRDGSARDVSTDLTLSAGDHDLRVEYYERSGAASIQLSYARLLLPPTPTPSRTPAPATSTATASPAPSVTPSPTPSVTPIPLPTQAPPPTNTPRPTPIPVPTSTPTRQPTATPRATSTTRPTATATPIPAPATATVTAIPEYTATPTRTPSPTATDTPLPPTATPTELPTETPVPPTATPTEQPTETPVPPTATPTEQPTETPVPPTATPTEMPSETPLPPTATPTLAPGEPPTATVTLSDTVLLIQGENWPAAARVTVSLSASATGANARRAGEVRANRRGVIAGRVVLRQPLGDKRYVVLSSADIRLIVPILGVESPASQPADSSTPAWRRIAWQHAATRMI